MPTLTHQISVVYHFRLRFTDRFRNTGNQEIRDDATVMIPRTDDDEIGFKKTLDCQRIRPGFRIQKNPTHADLFDFHILIDLILPSKKFPVLELEKKIRVRHDHRNHLTFHVQYPGSLPDRFREIPRHLLKGGKEKVAETVTSQSSLLETIIDKFAEYFRRIRKGNQALTDISRRKHTKFVA